MIWLYFNETYKTCIEFFSLCLASLNVLNHHYQQYHTGAVANKTNYSLVERNAYGQMNMEGIAKK